MSSILLKSKQLLPTHINFNSPDVLYYADSFGIDESREIIAFLKLGPVREEFKYVIINNADAMTPEAQNALLKTLEEPPAYADIYLITSTPDALIPTVLSRLELKDPGFKGVQMRDLIPENPLIDALNDSKTKNLASKISSAQPFIKKRPEVLELLFEALLVQSSCIHSQPVPQTAIRAQDLLDTYKAINGNANLSLALEHLFIHW